jgi:hypothetical protein
LFANEEYYHISHLPSQFVTVMVSERDSRRKRDKDLLMHGVCKVQVLCPYTHA